MLERLVFKPAVLMFDGKPSVLVDPTQEAEESSLPTGSMRFAGMVLFGNGKRV